MSDKLQFVVRYLGSQNHLAVAGEPLRSVPQLIEDRGARYRRRF